MTRAEHASKLRAQGATLEEIARAFEVSPSTVWRWLHGATPRKPRQHRFASHDKPWKGDRPAAWDCELAQRTMFAMGKGL